MSYQLHSKFFIHLIISTLNHEELLIWQLEIENILNVLQKDIQNLLLNGYKLSLKKTVTVEVIVAIERKLFMQEEKLGLLVYLVYHTKMKENGRVLQQI